MLALGGIIFSLCRLRQNIRLRADVRVIINHEDLMHFPLNMSFLMVTYR